MARFMLRRASRFFFAGPIAHSSLAASMVPAQVRKSLAVMSRPVVSRRYALTSSEEMVCRFPCASRYWNSSCPGRSWHCCTMRASRLSGIDRKSVGEGKRGDLGGRRIIKKKKVKSQEEQTQRKKKQQKTEKRKTKVRDGGKGSRR